MVLMKKRFGLKNKIGFTLVEVLVVVAIMAVLGSIATVSYSAITKSAQQRAASSAIVNYWGIANDYFFVINAGFGGTPSRDQMCARTGIDNQHIFLSQDHPTDTNFPKDNPHAQSRPGVYVQYTEDKENIFQRYTVKKIVYRDSKGNYYYSLNGTEISGPVPSLLDIPNI